MSQAGRQPKLIGLLAVILIATAIITPPLQGAHFVQGIRCSAHVNPLDLPKNPMKDYYYTHFMDEAEAREGKQYTLARKWW